MSRRWATVNAEAESEASKPQPDQTIENIIPKAYGRLLVKMYSRSNHIRDRPKRLQVVLQRLRDEHADLPSRFKLATWKDEGMGYTVLHWAVYYNRYQMVQALVDAGCNVNARDGGQETPLFIACGKGDLDMVKKLVELGARVNLRSKDNDSPLLVAAREGNPNVVKYLLRNGALAQPAWFVYWHAGMAGNVKAIEVNFKLQWPLYDSVQTGKW